MTNQIADTAPVYICLLGPFRLLHKGKQLFRNSQKAELLLSALALQPRWVASRDFVLEAVWPGVDPQISGPLLRGLMCKLRQGLNSVLGGQPLVARDRDFLYLNLGALGERAGMDVTEFESYVVKGDRAARASDSNSAVQHYNRAVTLYRGDLLTNSAAYVEIERERLRSLYLRTLGYIAEDKFQCGDYIACLHYAFCMLISNPLHEHAHRTIMRCYVRRNERGQALRQFQLCAQTLRTELNIEPEHDTVSLYHQICADAARI